MNYGITDVLKEIVNSIEDNKFVLILGPDLYLKEFEGEIIEKKSLFMIDYWGQYIKKLQETLFSLKV